MVNLVLDTNAWIYLANGFNPENQKNEEENHFLLAEWLRVRIEEKKCRIFSNYIVKKEWTRNKSVCSQLITKYEAQIAILQNLLKKRRSSIDFLEFSGNTKKEVEVLQEKINKNKKHIGLIENILEQSLDIPISDQQKVIVTEWAIDKKPPFHHKNNSVGDALIFLSTVDFFYFNNEELYIKNTVFVSSNTSDYALKAGDKVLHPDLDSMLKDKPVIFETNLARALQCGDEIIAAYQRFLDYFNRDVIACLIECKGVSYNLAEVEFVDKLIIEENEQSIPYNPLQVRLSFGQQFDLSNEELLLLGQDDQKVVDIGTCTFCRAIHVRCCCGVEHASYHDEISCGCGREFLIANGVSLKV